jgi:hypothetical protein
LRRVYRAPMGRLAQRFGNLRTVQVIPETAKSIRAN